MPPAGKAPFVPPPMDSGSRERGTSVPCQCSQPLPNCTAEAFKGFHHVSFVNNQFLHKHPIKACRRTQRSSCLAMTSNENVMRGFACILHPNICRAPNSVRTPVLVSLTEIGGSPASGLGRNGLRDPVPTDLYH